MMMAKDAFGQWQEWTSKPADSDLSIPSDLHGTVMALAPDDRLDRDKVNQAVSEARDPNTQRVWTYIDASKPVAT